jgi:hypothetical protein
MATVPTSKEYNQMQLDHFTQVLRGPGQDKADSIYIYVAQTTYGPRYFSASHVDTIDGDVTSNVAADLIAFDNALQADGWVRSSDPDYYTM